MIKNEVISRDIIYKVKPKDIMQSHFALFDNFLQSTTLEALDKIFKRGEAVDENTLKREMDISEKAWIQFKKDIMSFVVGIPNPYIERDGNQHMIVLVGVPGSGKSTVSKLLESKGWIRVNQDDLGNRRACETLTMNSLKEGKSVIIDRCNFDFSQRSTWTKMASKFNVSTIRCLFLNVPLQVCKDRVAVREDHPTIPGGDYGHKIIDKFTDILCSPLKAEGFCEIFTITHPDELQPILEHFSSIKIKSI